MTWRLTSLLGCLRGDVAAAVSGGGRGMSPDRGEAPTIPEVVDGVIFERSKRSSVQGAHLLLHHVSPLVRRQAQQILQHKHEMFRSSRSAVTAG